MNKKIVLMSVISTLLVVSCGCSMGNVEFDDSTHQQTVSTPVITLEGDFGDLGQKLVIKSNTPAVSIRYTTDGTIPSESNGIYYNAFSYLEAPTTVQAIAYRAGYKNSNVTSRDFFKISDPYPSISLDGNSVTLYTTGTDIYYSRSGLTPTSSSDKYYGQIFASSILGDTLKIIATKPNSIKSNIVEIKKQTKPVFMELSSGVYIFHSLPTDINLLYTTDGSSPTRINGNHATNGDKIAVSKGSIIKAIAYTNNSLNSDVATHYYW